LTQTCSNDPGCPANMSRCPDGSCANNTNECFKYDGCPPQSPIQCPTGSCVSNITDCFCKQTTKFKCFNGTCANQFSDCEPPPSSKKPLPFSETLNTTQPQIIEIASSDQSILCTLTIPSGTFETPELISISIDSMTDSELRSTFFDSGKPEVISSVIVINVPPEVPQPFAHDIDISCFISLPKNANSSSICLAFVKQNNQGSYENEEWNCSSSAASNSSNGVLLVGKTNHFTSYAMLLGNQQTGSSSATSSGSTTFLLYIIIGVVAVVVIIISCILIEVYRRKVKRREMSDMSVTMTEMDTRRSRY